MGLPTGARKDPCGDKFFQKRLFFLFSSERCHRTHRFGHSWANLRMKPLKLIPMNSLPRCPQFVPAVLLLLAMCGPLASNARCADASALVDDFSNATQT